MRTKKDRFEVLRAWLFILIIRDGTYKKQERDEKGTTYTPNYIEVWTKHIFLFEMQSENNRSSKTSGINRFFE